MLQKENTMQEEPFDPFSIGKVLESETNVKNEPEMPMLYTHIRW